MTNEQMNEDKTLPKPRKGTKKINNKQITVKKIKGLHIKKFRKIENETFNLSDRITLFAGHNGTMKSTLIALFVQSFNSKTKDVFNTELKEKFGQIFKLSKDYDKNRYDYNLIIEDNEEMTLSIPVYTKPRSKDDPRIRIVTGGAQKGDGNLVFNTSYLNLNRLYSIHDSDASPISSNLTEEEKRFISDFYSEVLLNDSYKDIETIHKKNLKKTFGPIGHKYNYESISSGEDNLGRFANSLVSFMRAAKLNENNTFNGILCIDEIEASLHPVAQINLFNYLYKWSRKYKVQIVANTHSLPLLRHAILESQNGKEIKTYYLSTLYSKKLNVYENPSYEMIYKELTFEFNVEDKDLPKINIICEDKLAITFVKRMVTSQKILKRLNFIVPDKGEGFPFKFLVKLCQSASSFLTDTIIIFDADVAEEALKKIKKNDNIIQLPDKLEKLPIEKLFIKFLYEKPVEDDIFQKKIGMPRAKFINTLNLARIKINAENTLHNLDTELCKKWFEKNQQIVNKAFTTFAKQVNGKDEFVKELIDKINKLCVKNGYPLLETK
ncbi:AAA family ATPase [Bacillus haynesii]|uniref:AAA family ATPase n=1 Tax=Bacillus haynesii TaxID=1925021 RepID=UPI002280E28B|nr:AAA family ATPase [Bacillus haynesii]MCY8573579.1 AAA family ATPase [Bacillus haynesii]MCY8592978.1 AAA family ATPase [Bacillus haynesii]